MNTVSTELLTAIGGSLATILVATLATINKSIPFKISFGGEKKMSECVTKEDLRSNCELRQSTLDKKLERIFTAIQETNSKIEELHRTVIQHRIDLGERLARVEESHAKA